MKKHLAFTLLLALSPALFACDNAQKAFCGQAASHLCARCQQCGDYAPCGLLRIQPADSDAQTRCIQQLESVCAAYDNVFTRETAQNCLTQIDDANSCDEFKASGKPDICSKLF